jgi:hypothetical protein
VNDIREPDAPRSPGRLVVYLGSMKNITGCAFGLVGLVLFFTGVIGDIWFVIVPALYLAGALIAPARPARTLFGGMLDPGGVRASLKSLRRDIHSRVPPDIEARVATITKTIEGILPRAGRLTPGSQDVFILQRTATDYLPTALRTYMDLPRDYADTHPVEKGRTARQVLTDQLDLLAEQMDEVATAVNRNDVDRLLAHGRFLEERFGQSGLSIDPERPPDVNDGAEG